MKKSAKNLVIVLMVALISTIIVGCGENNQSLFPDDTEYQKAYDENELDFVSGLSTTEGEEYVTDKKEAVSDIIPLEDVITDGLPFSGGLTFVSTSKDKTILNVCINQKGETQFVLPTGAFAKSAFNSGNAIVTIDNVQCMVNSNGSVIVSPQTHGYTSGAVIKNDIIQKAFCDGYFFVYKEIISFDKTVYEFGVIGADGEWILELTEDKYFAEKYRNVIYRITDYANDYAQIADGYWVNVKNGEIVEEFDPYDLKRDLFGVGYVDKNGNLVVNIKEKYPTIERAGSFVEGCDYVVAVFCNNSKCFFSLLDRAGELLFDPIEMKNKYSCGYLQKQNIYWVYSADGMIKIYDSNGGLKFELKTDADTKYTTGVEVICIDPDNGFLIKETHDFPNQYLSYAYYYVDASGNRILG